MSALDANNFRKQIIYNLYSTGPISLLWQIDLTWVQLLFLCLFWSFSHLHALFSNIFIMLRQNSYKKYKIYLFYLYKERSKANIRKAIRVCRNSVLTLSKITNKKIPQGNFKSESLLSNSKILSPNQYIKKMENIHFLI